MARLVSLTLLSIHAREGQLQAIINHALMRSQLPYTTTGYYTFEQQHNEAGMINMRIKYLHNNIMFGKKYVSVQF